VAADAVSGRAAARRAREVRERRRSLAAKVELVVFMMVG
jgi:hypothetical protein